MEFGFVIAAGMLAREITQIIIEWRHLQEQRSWQVIVSIIVTFAVAGALSALPSVEFSEALVAQIWAIAFATHLAKGIVAAVNEKGQRPQAGSLRHRPS